MAQAGYTPIQLYHSTTGGNAPSGANLVNGELAINITDGRLYYKDNSGNVQILATKAATAGQFAGSSSAGASIQLYEDTDNGTNYVGFQAPASIPSNVTWVLPSADGSSNQVLATDGAGTLSWVNQTGGGGGGGGGTSTTTTQFTATGGQTTFSVAYTVGQIGVYMNGALLASADYTASNGTSVVLAAGATSGDIVTVVAYATASQILQGDSNVTVTDTGSNGTITFTTDGSERMRITAAGRVGIGTNSPNQALDVRAAGVAAFFTATNGNANQIGFSNAAGATPYAYMGTPSSNTLQFADSGGNEMMRLTTSAASIGSTGASGSRFFVVGYAQASGGVQDAVIEALLGDDGSYGKTGTRAAIKAVTNGVGRGATPYGIYVTSSETDVGTCYGAYHLATGVYGSQYATFSEVSKDLGAFSTGYCHYSKATTTSSGGSVVFYWGEHNGTTRFYVAMNGGIGNYQANDTNLSDRREKKDFAPAKNYLETICQIPVQTFKYIDQLDDEPTLGVVAQDVQAVAPELVNESNWAGPDQEEKVRLSIYQTDLQYALMKCIQELKAELDTAKQRIAALEGK